ncbi:sigma 54-interacting transcriptional regulator [Mucilaginibacter sp. McL0603]|uniref:sigma 54-interacting transcriptional regulator n=1 Tax=Mucilaginibacter sp. McL0603 TaxID=3415670 RepID=UPI003CEEDDBC
MKLNVLIVEDQFLEAENLSIILKKAGHSIHGIAKSVDQAIGLLRKSMPDIVLVDIVLKGDLSGIDLADMLNKKNIPFIFLSANSNATTFEEAIETKPYGFLVKPFREKELLLALNIAIYRYQKNLELVSRQQTWLNGLLTYVIEMPGSKDDKTLSLIRALTSFLPFDFIIIDTKLADKNESAVHRYLRTGFDEYVKISDKAMESDCGIIAEDLVAARKKYNGNDNAYFLNGQDFLDHCALSLLTDKMRRAKNFNAMLWLPLVSQWNVNMAITFYRCTEESYTQDHLDLMISTQKLISEVVDSIRKTSHDQRSEEYKPSKSPNQLLRPVVEGIIGNSPQLIKALDKVTQVAPFDNTVLILGETGVGKEGIVKAIHQLSPRKGRPLVRVNCAAIPVNLVESELFGHEKGAFTGAIERRVGKFEQANGGTLFLDEIGELPVEIQSKLLRAIQEKEIERVGGRTTIKTDVRIITATNRNLLKEIAAGRFRMDLYYRINVFPICLPPLRERKEDIPALANYFLKSYGSNIRSETMSLSAAALKQLRDYSWPGNIRELQHLIERHVLQSQSSRIDMFEMPDEIAANEGLPTAEPEIKSYVEMDRVHIIGALKKSNGKVSGPGGAAELLKLPPTTLRSKMKRLGIAWPNLLI